MSTAPELRRQVTREMIEAHYKSVMNAALVLLSQDCVALAQNVLSEACSRPYPSPAPATTSAPVDDVQIALVKLADAVDRAPGHLPGYMQEAMAAARRALHIRATLKATDRATGGPP